MLADADSATVCMRCILVLERRSCIEASPKLLVVVETVFEAADIDLQNVNKQHKTQYLLIITTIRSNQCCLLL